MRRYSWIVWLMLCLLPLRGWAQAGMPAPATAIPATVAALPCHDTGSAHADNSSGTATGCAACDLCHTAALPTAMPRWSPGDVPRIAPMAALVPDTGRGDPDRLERPPRESAR